LVERLGNETNISLTLPYGSGWLVVLDGDHDLAVNQSVALTFAPEAAILFDDSGRARHAAA
jgi:multiple sugar transport system ATP-binding protein